MTVHLGNNTVETTAELEVVSTDSGILVSRMTTAQRDAISSPAESLMIFNTDNNEYEWYDNDNSAWVAFNSGNVNRLEVINNTGSPIATEKAVYISGYDNSAGLPEISLADADAGSGAEKAIGMTQATIASGSTGFVTTLGIAFYPTTGLSVGDNLYVSTTAGSLTATAPTTEVYFAEVVKVGASGVGVIFINPTPQGIGIIPTSSANVSNPPTDAELDSAFGTPATVGNGFTALLDDAGGDTNVYAVYSNGTSWFYTTLTKAV